MKNKKLTYILLPVVALIWGAIIYQVLAPNDNFTAVPLALFEEEFEVQKVVQKELVLNYPDPFLKNRKWGSKALNKTTPVKVINPTMVKSNRNNQSMEAKLIWPTVNFTGTVNSGALITVNNRAYILKQGDTINSVSFDLIAQDSLKVSYKGESKTIHKKKF